MNVIKKNRMLWLISKRCFFPSPCWKHVGIFLQYLLWESSWVPGGKSHNIMGAPLWLGLPGVFNSQSCPHWASSHLWITVQVFYPGTGSHSGFHSWVSGLVSCLSLYSCVSLQSWGQRFALCPPLSYGSKMKCWFFSLFTCLLVGNQWWLPCSWHAEPKPGSPHYNP